MLDQAGVGKLLAMACELDRKARPDINLGICGEHGGEPSSIAFCHKAGLNYVSCSPYRVPVARLAAAPDASAFRCQAHTSRHQRLDSKFGSYPNEKKPQHTLGLSLFDLKSLSRSTTAPASAPEVS